MTKKLVKDRRRRDLEYFEALREQTIVNQPGKEVKMLDIHEKTDKEKLEVTLQSNNKCQYLVERISSKCKNEGRLERFN